MLPVAIHTVHLSPTHIFPHHTPSHIIPLPCHTLSHHILPHHTPSYIIPHPSSHQHITHSPSHITPLPHHALPHHTPSLITPTNTTHRVSLGGGGEGAFPPPPFKNDSRCIMFARQLMLPPYLPCHAMVFCPPLNDWNIPHTPTCRTVPTGFSSILPHSTGESSVTQPVQLSASGGQSTLPPLEPETWATLAWLMCCTGMGS